MQVTVKQACLGTAVILGSALLSGCYQSDSSIISAADSIMPLKVGRYCQYDFDNTQREWSPVCNSTVISSTSANTYTVKNTSLDTVYTVHISGKPLATGDLTGNYVVEACDTKDTTVSCYVGTLKVFDNQNFHFVYPTCTTTDETDCKLADEAAARAAFAEAKTWGTDDLRKYVWQED